MPIPPEIEMHTDISSPTSDSAKTDAVTLEGSAWAQLKSYDLDTIRSFIEQKAPWIGIEYVPAAHAVTVVDELQTGLDSIRPGDFEVRRKYIKCLQRLSSKYGILPSQLYISRSRIETFEEFQPGGAFSDISSARIRGVAYPVCLKRLRIYKNVAKLKKILCEEALIWRQVRHDNILPFYGVVEDVTDYPSLCLISPWMEQGNVHDFLENNPHHDRRGMSWDITAGVQYLHGLDPCVIHRDIRGANILVGPAPENRCFLVDFGLRQIAETQFVGTTTQSAGTVRWQPPELIGATQLDCSLMRQIDVYALACTFVELWTGKPPYSDLETDAAVVSRMAQGGYPPQPSELLPAELWRSIVKPCLSPCPKDRPSAKRILELFRSLYPTYFDWYIEGRKHTEPYSSVGFLSVLPQACTSHARSPVLSSEADTSNTTA